MSDMEIESPSRGGPIVATIAGDAGTGKSSLAALFPNPIFIRAEDGVKRISRQIEMPKAFKPIRWPDKKVDPNPTDLWDQLFWLAREDHDYKTLVIDSISKLDEIFIQSVLELDGKARGLNQAMGGYGNGAAHVAAAHRRVRKGAEVLKEKRGMNVVFIAHADQENMRLPDREDFQRYSLRMLKNSSAPYIDDVDFVGFVRLQYALRGEDDERKKVVSNGDRELACHASAASVAKNPFSITEPLEFEEGTNPLAQYLDATPAKPKRGKKVEPEPEEVAEAPDGDV